MGIDRYIGILPTGTSTFGEWTVNYFTSPAICLDGSGFIASVKKKDPRKAVLYLEGGGGCWDYDSCYGFLPTVEKKAAGLPPTLPSGLLDDTDPRNPFKDWSMVYGSYCDGSVWSGDTDNVYTNADGTDNRLTHHHGHADVSAAVTLLRENFPLAETVLVTGVSAGGYGTLMAYMVTKTQYPISTVDVINDSGPGLYNPSSPGLLNKARISWGFDKFLPKGNACPQCNEQLLYIVEWYLRRDPRLSFGLVSYEWDFMVGLIFLQMSGPDYEKLLVTTSGNIHDRYPDRFKRFFMIGRDHTIISSPPYYTRAVKGTVVSQWTEDLVTGSPVWSDLIE